MGSKVWTAEKMQEGVTALPENYCFMIGSPLGPIDFCYKGQYDGEELDKVQACVEPTIGYDTNLFNEDAIETLSKVDFSFWSLIAMPRDALSEDALNQL